MRLFLNRVHYPVTALGYGRRVGIWFQGCSRHCPGCVSADTWAPGLGETSVESLVAAITPWLEGAEGVTITGGEPLEQREALFDLLAAVRPRLAGDVLLYTGYPWEEKASELLDLGGFVDATITDPYLPTSGQTLVLRGSDNQRLHCLTPLGEERYGHLRFAVDNGPRPTFDLLIDGKGDVWLAGIPRPRDLGCLASLLAARGFAAATSEDRPKGWQ